MNRRLNLSGDASWIRSAVSVFVVKAMFHSVGPPPCPDPTLSASMSLSPLLISVQGARLLPSALFFLSPFFPGQSQPFAWLVLKPSNLKPSRLALPVGP